jgi:hypothetical protein
MAVTPKQKANLRPKLISSTEEAKRLGRLGGIANAKAVKEKKTYSKILADYLVQNHKVKIGKKEIDLTPEEIIFRGVTKAILSGSSATASILTVAADRTEGPSGGGSEGSKKDADLLGSLLGVSPNESKTNKDGEE